MKEQKAAFVFTGYEFADENGIGTGKIVHVPMTINYKEALKNTTIFTSTVMFDMEQLSKEELQMPQIKSEDTALWWRILRGGKFGKISESGEIPVFQQDRSSAQDLESVS